VVSETLDAKRINTAVSDVTEVDVTWSPASRSSIEDEFKQRVSIAGIMTHFVDKSARPPVIFYPCDDWY